MLNSPPTRLFWRSLNWLTRLVVAALSVMTVLIGLTIIVLRYWILPDIGQYHDSITSSLTGAIGSTVSIGKIEGDWQGFQPHLSFVDVRILDAQQQPVLLLSRIDSKVSWMSLLTAELRLASLEIDHPELLVRRDTQGRFFIGGVMLSAQGGDNKLADWLLRQSRIVVRDALIVWVDEQRGAPTLLLQQVNLRIESLFNQHRFALRALPPEELATPLDVRGDFFGASFDDLHAWRGQIFTQMDYTDVTAGRSWLELPDEFSQGRGALRGWLGIEGGEVIGITADVALHDVVTNLAVGMPESNVPAMNILEVRGRAAWQKMTNGFEVSTRNFAMRLQNGIELQPTNIYFLVEKSANQASTDQKSTNGVLRANALELESLVGLAKFLPIEASLRERLEAYAPKGKVSKLEAHWQGPFAQLGNFKLAGHFEDIAINQVGNMPGFSGLTVDVDGNETGGRISINARQLGVDAPNQLREPLSFTTLTGQVGWQRKNGEWLINVDQVALSNDDLAGNVYGSYQTRAGTLGVLDLTGSLTRGDVRRAARYTPLIALHHAGNDWLNGALLAGHTEDFSIRIKGNLSDFPPDGSDKVLFKIGGHAQDVVLEFDKNWPRIEKISGEFLIQGNKLEVNAPTAVMAGAGLQNVTVALPDMTSKELALQINGTANATSNVLLQFVQHSPVRGYIGGFTDGMSASGNGRLDLSLHLPLSGDAPVRVSGDVHVQDNDINLGEGMPLLRNTRGFVSFTESSMKASGILAEMLGGTARINVQTAEGGAVQVKVQGQSNLDILRRSEPHPLLNYLHGTTSWDADISVVNKSTRVIINSDLRGISSSLPQPFTKRANEIWPLRVEKSDVSADQDAISAQLGKLLNMRLLRQNSHGAMLIQRGLISFGNQDPLKEAKMWQKLSSGKAGSSAKLRTGVWLTGSLPELSVQGWEGLAGDTGKPAPAFPVNGANLRIEKLTGYGQAFKEVRIIAGKRGKGLSAQLTSSMLTGGGLNGEVLWQPPAALPRPSLPRLELSQPAAANAEPGYDKNGKVSVHLRNLQLIKAEQPSELLPPVKPAVLAKPTSPGNLPAMEITIEDMQISGRQIGRFEWVGHPEGPDWRLRRLRITNPDGALMGDGVWHGDATTQVNLMLDISDAGKILERSNYPNTVKGGSGKLTASLSWTGTPAEFNYATLNGTLKLDTGNGQFLQMNPGAGKLLSILSMQALPKHITTLDFTDVFSKGFQFDNIIGEAVINNGVMNTQEFHVYGSAAKAALKGSVDLNRETQDLSITVFPAIGDSVSLLAVFAINPAAGIAGLIASQLLDNPFDKLVSFEYNVSGTWADPSVNKVGKNSVKPK